MYQAILPGNSKDSEISYTYDDAGRRIRQVVGSDVTKYLWDETSIYGDVVMESDGSGAILASYILAGAQLGTSLRNMIYLYPYQSHSTVSQATFGELPILYSLEISANFGNVNVLQA
ncbi:MAG: hypothetical protein JXA13_03550 [Anaerolineales bacterium]|nr:hypothetical protein [Anaerolineales bacterium]